MTKAKSVPPGRPAESTAVSRRTSLAVGLVAPMMMVEAPARATDNAVVRSLVQRAEHQARLFNTGEMARWLDVANPGANFTLMQPFGGPVSHGFDQSPEHLAALSAAFRNGNATLELSQAIASEDIVVLVYIERQAIEVSGLPKQDWSLRVTQVFQRQGPDWQLVHRHADPLVRTIPLNVAAALAAGESVVARLAPGA